MGRKIGATESQEPQISNRDTTAKTSPLGTSRAFVPAAEQSGGQHRERRENRDAGHRDQSERREHARDVQAIACFRNTESKASALACVACREFGGDRADQS